MKYFLSLLLSLLIAAPAGAASFRSSNSATNPASNSVDCPAPAGQTFGDIVLISVVRSGDGAGAVAGLVAPTNGTLIWDAGITAGGTSYHWIVWWVRATAQPTYSVSWTSGAYADIRCAAYSGALTTGNPIDASGTGTATTTTTHTAPSVNSTYTNSLWIGLAVEDNYSAWTVPGGWTEDWDGGATLHGVGNHRTVPGTGATGTQAFTSAASGGGLAGSILLIDASPAGGGGATPVRRPAIVIQ